MLLRAYPQVVKNAIWQSKAKKMNHLLALLWTAPCLASVVQALVNRRVILESLEAWKLGSLVCDTLGTLASGFSWRRNWAAWWQSFYSLALGTSSFTSQSTMIPKHSGLKSKKYLPCQAARHPKASKLPSIADTLIQSPRKNLNPLTGTCESRGTLAMYASLNMWFK